MTRGRATAINSKSVNKKNPTSSIAGKRRPVLNGKTTPVARTNKKSQLSLSQIESELTSSSENENDNGNGNESPIMSTEFADVEIPNTRVTNNANSTAMMDNIGNESNINNINTNNPSTNSKSTKKAKFSGALVPAGKGKAKSRSVSTVSGKIRRDPQHQQQQQSNSSTGRDHDTDADDDYSSDSTNTSISSVNTNNEVHRKPHGYRGTKTKPKFSRPSSEFQEEEEEDDDSVVEDEGDDSFNEDENEEDEEEDDDGEYDEIQKDSLSPSASVRPVKFSHKNGSLKIAIKLNNGSDVGAQNPSPKLINTNFSSMSVQPSTINISGTTTSNINSTGNTRNKQDLMDESPSTTLRKRQRELESINDHTTPPLLPPPPNDLKIKIKLSQQHQQQLQHQLLQQQKLSFSPLNAIDMSSCLMIQKVITSKANVSNMDEFSEQDLNALEEELSRLKNIAEERVDILTKERKKMETWQKNSQILQNSPNASAQLQSESYSDSEVITAGKKRKKVSQLQQKRKVRSANVLQFHKEMII